MKQVAQKNKWNCPEKPVVSTACTDNSQQWKKNTNMPPLVNMQQEARSMQCNTIDQSTNHCIYTVGHKKVPLLFLR